MVQVNGDSESAREPGGDASTAGRTSCPCSVAGARLALHDEGRVTDCSPLVGGLQEHGIVPTPVFRTPEG